VEWAFAVLLVVVVFWPTGGERRRGRALFRHTGPQWRRMYGRRAFLRYGLALGTAAVLAYSGADEAIDRWHGRALNTREGRGSHELPPSRSDRVAEVVKFAGERFWFGVWAVAAAVDWLWKSSPVSRWGRDNFEAMVVGLPLLWTTQRVLGSNRPSSDTGDPRWQPFRHANAASGHAFVGAIPVWTLAQRVDQDTGRWALRTAGLVTGWSRLNDRKHYLSQTLLGWTIAGNAVAAVRPRGEEAAGGAVPAAGDSRPLHP